MSPPLGLGLGLANMVGAAAPPPFVPTSLSGCVLWLRADTAFTAGGGGSWVDQSATGATFTVAAGAPRLTASSVNGKPGVTFSASNPDELSAPHNAAWNLAAFTFYAVFKPNGTFPGFGALIGKLASSAWASGWAMLNSSGTANELDVWSGAYTTYGQCGSVSSGVGAALRGDYDGVTVSGFMNGVAGTSHAAAEVDNTAALLIGGAPGGGSFTGDILDVIVYNRVLSSGEKTQVSNYTSTRYGLSS